VGEIKGRRECQPPDGKGEKGEKARRRKGRERTAIARRAHRPLAAAASHALTDQQAPAGHPCDQLLFAYDRDALAGEAHSNCTIAH